MILKNTLKASTLATLIALGSVGASSALAQNAALVNGQSIPSELVDFIVKKQTERGGQQATPEMRTMIRQELVKQEVLKQEALKKGLNSKKEVKYQIQMMNQAILANALRDDFIGSHKPSEAETKDAYNKIIKTISGPEYLASHVLVKTEDEAKAIIAKLGKGGDFAEIAKAESQDPGSASQGGSLEWVNPSAFVPEFAAELAALKKGEYSKSPVKTQYGYHVVLVKDKRETTPPAFDQVREQVEQQLLAEKWETYMDKLTSSAKVK